MLKNIRAVVKRTTLGLLDQSGANAWIAARQGRQMWIPCYHGVVSAARLQEREGYENTVSVKEFQRQLEWMGKHYRFVDLAGALRWLQQPDEGRPPVLVSFDDGYRNNLTLAAPVLQRLGIPAVFFLSTGYVGTDRILWPLELDARLAHSCGMRIPFPGRNGEEVTIPAEVGPRATLAMRLRQVLKAIPNRERIQYLEVFRGATQLDPSKVDGELNDFLSWDEARQLASLGFDIGSHTKEHPILSRLEETELAEELGHSKQILEVELKRPIQTLAYPNGGAADYSAAVVKQAKALGYEAAFAVDDRWQEPLGGGPNDRLFGISRTIVPGHLGDSTFSFIASGARNRFNGNRA